MSDARLACLFCAGPALLLAAIFFAAHLAALLARASTRSV